MCKSKRCRKRILGVKEAARKKKYIYHGILLRDTLVLSCLLIKALICLAEGKEAGIRADIIAKLKAMPSGSWASTMLYLQEPSCLVARRIYLFIYYEFCYHISCLLPGKHMMMRKARTAFRERIGTARLAFETTWRRPPFGGRGNRTESSVIAAIHQDLWRESFITGSIRC